MGRVIRNQRKGRGSIFSECDRHPEFLNDFQKKKKERERETEREGERE